MSETDKPSASPDGAGPEPPAGADAPDAGTPGAQASEVGRRQLDDDVPTVHAVPRDPEEAQRALVEILDLLGRYEQFREQSRDQQRDQQREQARARVRERAREAIRTPPADDRAAGPDEARDRPRAPDEDRQDRDAEDPTAEPLSESQYLTRLRSRVDALHPADVAYVLEALPQEDRMLVWQSVKAEADGAILLEVSEPVRDTLIESMTNPELVAAARSLDADDLADLAADLPFEVVEEVRRQLTPEEREQLRAAMSYPEDTVGGRMDFDLVTVREDVSLEVVLRYLRRFDELPQHTDQVFVVDRDDFLKGALPIDQLLINEPDTLVSDVMRRDVLALHGLDEAGEAAQAFERYDLVSAPVVDPHGHLIGRLTIDEVVDVIREQTEAEILSAAGLREEEDLFAPVLRSARNRGLWLALNLATAFFASRVIGLFEDTIERIVALAALMPIVAGIAGNSGNQTMTLVIRALALGQVTGGNFGRLVRKELMIATLNGMVWGGIAGVLTFLLYQGTDFAPRLAVTMMAAMVLNLLVGALIAVLVPLTLDRLGRDPAIGSSVLLTFSTDSLGFLIFLGLATILFA